MTAPPIADDVLTETECRTESLLAEQIVKFANEAYVFGQTDRSSRPQQALQTLKRFPAPPQAYFADVAPPLLNAIQLRNSRVVPTREQILPLLPKGGVCVEIGVGTGDFAWQMLSVLEPSRLVLCDPDFNSFDDSSFSQAIESGIVEMHEGDAAEHLAARPDQHFDLICLHPDHSYAGAARALEQASRKLKRDGCIFCSNYTTYLPLEGLKCGVVRAVNEFCHTAGFEITCLALNSLGYQDIVLRRRPGPEASQHLGGAVVEAPDTNTFLPDVWEHLIDKYEIESVLDVGAGAGWSTKWFVDRGIYALGVEGCREAIDKSQCHHNMFGHDYSTGPFVPSMLLDLAWCAGFVEQIEEQFIPNFMASFRSCRYVCLTHAEPGQAGYHHVNCQPTEYWIRKMDEAGFDFDAGETACLRLTDKHKAPRGRRSLTFFKRRTIANA